MQINFFMNPQDRFAFHEYIFSKGGYMTPSRIDSAITPVFTTPSDINEEHFDLKLFRESIFSKDHYTDSNWVRWHAPSKTYYVWGPGIEYSASFQRSVNIYSYRLYMGTVSPSSFVKPEESLEGTYQKYAIEYKKLENFYKSCCGYIRRTCRKEGGIGGFYFGKGIDQERAMRGEVDL
jgi:hypothetical protein